MSAPFSCSSADLSSGRASAGGGRFDWSACPGSTVDVMVAEPVGASDESPGSNSTMTYQDIEYPGGAYGSMAVAQTMDAYGLQCMLDYELSSPTFNWSRPFLSADETSVHGLIQEVMYSSRPYCQQESDQIHKIRSTLDLLEDRHAMCSSTDWDSALFPASSVLPERSWHEQVDESLQPPPVEPHRKPKQQVQLTDEAPFWNPSVSIATGAYSTRMHHSEPIHEEVKKNKIKAKYSGAKKCSSSSLDENDGSEPVLKKPRIETPSPLPTFKVRKEKLGDRITALQQLVSPFGKTDTASVLHEAIDYIKFLHDQVQVLSSPHSNVKDQTPRAIESAGTNQDLRSRGLCLVPISSTVQIVASENPVDFWSLGFGAAHS